MPALFRHFRTPGNGCGRGRSRGRGGRVGWAAIFPFSLPPLSPLFPPQTIWRGAVSTSDGQDAVEFLARHQPHFLDQFGNAAAAAQRFLRHARGVLITDVGIQCRRQAGRGAHALGEQLLLAVMPTTQCCVGVRQPAARCSTLLNRLCAMIGSKAFSCSCPASAAMVIVTSLPITSKAIWFPLPGSPGS